MLDDLNSIIGSNQRVIITSGKSEENLSNTETGKNNDNVVVYTMPKSFLTQHTTVHQAKYTGMIILAVGAMFLLMAFAAAYYFLLVQPKQAALNTGGTQAAQNEAGKETPADSQELNEKASAAGQTEKTAGEKEETGQPAVTEINEGVGTATASDIVMAENSETEEAATATRKIVAPSDINEEPANEAQNPAVRKAEDNDQDGLSDIEEMLFGCNSRLKDSDGDGYEDLAEINNLYNPAGSGKISDNPNIKKFTEAGLAYTLYYPEIWSWEKAQSEDTVIFEIGNNQFMQIMADENAQNLPLEAWYLEQMEIEAIPESQLFDKNGWLGIMSADGLTAYLAKPGQAKIYVINYNIGTNSVLSYLNAFKLMTVSFELK